MDPNLVRGLAAHLQRLSSSIASSLPAQHPPKRLTHRDPHLHTSQSPQRDVPRTHRSSRPPSRFKQSSELSPVPHHESSSPLTSLIHSHQVQSETNPLGLQELQEPSKQLMPSELPLKASVEYPSCFTSQTRYEDEAMQEKENIPLRRQAEEEAMLRVMEKAKVSEEENSRLKKEIDLLSASLEGSLSRAQLCQIEAQCQVRETEAVRRLEGVASRLLHFGGPSMGGRVTSFSSLREALSLPPSEANSALCSARGEGAKTLQEVVEELEKNVQNAESSILSREKMKEELQGRMVKQVRESLRDELLREREEHSRREEEVVRRVRQEEAVKQTFETERMREEMERLKREAEGGEYESEMFILRCENDRLSQRLERSEKRQMEEIRRMVQELEEEKRQRRVAEEQKKKIQREMEMEGIQKKELRERLGGAEERRKEGDRAIERMKEEINVKEEELKKLKKVVAEERGAKEELRLELQKWKKEAEDAGRQREEMRIEIESGAERVEEKVKEAVNEALQRVEEQWEGRVELVKQMGKEKAEEMRKVHERVLAETELALEKERKQRAVDVEKARLEGRQEEEKARLEVAKELHALKQSEMKYVEGNQRLLASKFKGEIDRMKILLEKLASRHLNSAACSQDFFHSDLQEAKAGIIHLEKKLNMQFSVEKSGEEEQELKQKEKPQVMLTMSLDPSISMENPLLSIKSDQGIMIPSSPATEKKSGISREMQSEGGGKWDERVCLRCGGNSLTGDCKFHPYRTHQGVSALLYTEVWNQCREDCKEKRSIPCYAENSHFYGERIPYKRRVNRTFFSLQNMPEEADFSEGNCSRGTITVGGQVMKSRGRAMKSMRESVDQRQSLDRVQIRQAMRSVRERMQQLQAPGEKKL